MSGIPANEVPGYSHQYSGQCLKTGSKSRIRHIVAFTNAPDEDNHRILRGGVKDLVLKKNEEIQRMGVVEKGDKFTFEAIKALGGIPNSVVQRCLFPPTSGEEWECEVECQHCGDRKWIGVTRSKFLKSYRTWAGEGYPCQKYNYEQAQCEKKRNRKKRSSRQMDLVAQTEAYVKEYLDPERQWNEGTDGHLMWSEVSQAADRQRWDLDQIKSAACSLAYGDFLKTPYWKAVARNVRHNSGYKCSLCNRKGSELHVHHVTYDHHGLEHLHIEDLVCLCKECHTKHHDKDSK